MFESHIFMKSKIYTALIIFILANCSYSSAQDSTYYPDGNPEKWNFRLTPFLWMPWISGELESPYLSQSFDVPVVDLLSNLKMAFMIDAEVSKGRFFATPTYMYVKLGAEEVIRTSHSGEESAVAKPELKMNIAELMGGMHFPLGSKWIIDPYVGFRYNSFNTLISVEGILDTNSVEETSVYWDPVIGFRAQYFPHPRVPLIFKADVGGFGAGSRLSCTAGLTGGYTISPQVDLLAGFSLYAADFVGETKTGGESSFSAAFYGFNLGIKIILPKRFRDPSVFNKSKSPN
jgi:hypothetical protein